MGARSDTGTCCAVQTIHHAVALNNSHDCEDQEEGSCVVGDGGVVEVEAEEEMAMKGKERTERVTPVPGGPPTQHLAVLETLISRGLPLSLPDVAGYTALHHCVLSMGESYPDKERIIQKLLASGADVNYRNRWGETPLSCAISNDDILGIDLLMEHGADVDLPDGNGITVRMCYRATGKAVSAAMEKWLLKRSGKAEAPMTSKVCDQCGKKGKPLRNCSGCLTVQYCSRECAAWKAHKAKCKPFTESSSVTLVPFYPGPRGWICPHEPLVRGFAGVPPPKPIPDSHLSIGHCPNNLPPGGKQAVVKIQIPGILKDFDGSTRPMLVYTQKRDFSCILRREDGQKEWDRVYDVVKNQTVSGLKGYFIADIKGPEKFVVKVSEPLAAQPW
ncbi:hypothetical protein NMY22_g19490 [Coprinellus aureogranulatus]|nr:hypothetical protein NMY22_g19490 [Coprinellus aureogranulatus]